MNTFLKALTMYFLLLTVNTSFSAEDFVCPEELHLLLTEQGDLFATALHYFPEGYVIGQSPNELLGTIEGGLASYNYTELLYELELDNNGKRRIRTRTQTCHYNVIIPTRKKQRGSYLSIQRSFEFKSIFNIQGLYRAPIFPQYWSFYPGYDFDDIMWYMKCTSDDPRQCRVKSVGTDTQSRKEYLVQQIGYVEPLQIENVNDYSHS